MNKVLSAFLLLILSIVVPDSLHAQKAIKDSAYGKVISIADGDTFTLLLSNNRQEKIRLHGIDAPEKGQDFGQAAKQKLSELIFSKRILIKRTDTDRYGRTIALVYYQVQCINEEMIRAGYAWHYVRYDSNKAWDQQEKEARVAKRGLWIQPNAIPPWDWRRK